MNVYEKVVGFIQKNDDNIFLLKGLGYSFVDIGKGQRTVRAFLEAGSLKSWMDGNRFDGVNGTDLLVEKLARLAGISRARLKKEMQPLYRRRALLYNLPNPYLAVEIRVPFKQAFQNIMKHIIDFDKKRIFDQSLERTLEEVARAIRTHDRATAGKVRFYNRTIEVKHYLYHHIDGRIFRFDIDGHLLETIDTDGNLP